MLVILARGQNGVEGDPLHEHRPAFGVDDRIELDLRAHRDVTQADAVVLELDAVVAKVAIQGHHRNQQAPSQVRAAANGVGRVIAELVDQGDDIDLRVIEVAVVLAAIVTNAAGRTELQISLVCEPRRPGEPVVETGTAQIDTAGLADGGRRRAVRGAGS